MSPLQFDTITIPAASGSGATLAPSCKRSHLAGSFFFCKAASAQFKMQFDGGTIFPCEAGFYSNGAASRWESITFYNYNTYPITLVYYCGAQGIGYSGTLGVKNVDTYTVGFGEGAADEGSGLIELKATNFPEGIILPGTNNGNRRKSIVIKCANPYGSGKPVLVQNMAAQNLLFINNGETITLETSDALNIKCFPWLWSSTSYVLICEVFYSA